MTELVSIAIISKDRPQILIDCLNDLLCKIPNNIPLILVDSSESNDHKKTIYDYINFNENLRKRTSLEQVNLIMGSLPVQRNICLKHCKTPYILFIDDDCFFDQDTYSGLEKLINKNQDRNIFGCRIIQGESISKALFTNKDLPNYSPFFWTRGSFNIEIFGVEEVDHIQGTFMCFNINALKQEKGFNENLVKGYAPFEDSYTVMGVAKLTETKPIIDFSFKVVHSIQPRLQGRSRDIGLDFLNAFAYARNGIIVSKRFHGFLKTIIAIPIVILINVVRIFRPMSSIKEFGKRMLSVFTFCAGVIVGIFFRN